MPLITVTLAPEQVFWHGDIVCTGYFEEHFVWIGLKGQPNSPEAELWVNKNWIKF